MDGIGFSPTPRGWAGRGHTAHAYDARMKQSEKNDPYVSKHP
jgi:hypothetical protein